MIAGVLLLVVGLVALAGGSASWLVIGLMIWFGMWMTFGGRRRRRRMQWATATQQVQHARPPYPLVPQARPAPALTTTPRPAAQLPPDVERKVDRIRRKAAVLGQQEDRFGRDDSEELKIPVRR